MKELSAKLMEIQKEVGAIAKDSKNPFFKSTYFDINGLLKEIKPILNKHGVLVMQPLTTSHSGVLSLTTQVVDADTGECMQFTCPLPTNEDPQKLGSAITYFRRYALQSLFLLQAEDDDANRASGKKSGNAQIDELNLD